MIVGSGWKCTELCLSRFSASSTLILLGFSKKYWLRKFVDYGMKWKEEKAKKAKNHVAP